MGINTGSRAEDKKYTTVELFAGAGGFVLGIEKAGFNNTEICSETGGKIQKEKIYFFDSSSKKYKLKS